MTEGAKSFSTKRRGSIYFAVALVWAIIMAAVTFIVDDPSNVVPFWLLLIAYYIAVWGKSARRP